MSQRVTLLFLEFKSKLELSMLSERNTEEECMQKSLSIFVCVLIFMVSFALTIMMTCALDLYMIKF